MDRDTYCLVTILESVHEYQNYGDKSEIIRTAENITVFIFESNAGERSSSGNGKKDKR